MIRRTLLATIAALALTAGAAHAQDATLKFGADSSPYPPFASQGADGKWTGFEVDLMDAVCAAEKLKCEMVGTAFDGIIPALNAKKIDVIWASMSITPERKKAVTFTNKYYNTPSEIVALKSTDLKIDARRIRRRLKARSSACSRQHDPRRLRPEAFRRSGHAENLR